MDIATLTASETNETKSNFDTGASIAFGSWWSMQLIKTSDNDLSPADVHKVVNQYARLALPASPVAPWNLITRLWDFSPVFFPPRDGEALDERCWTI